LHISAAQEEEGLMNKFLQPRPYTDPEVAARKIIELAEPIQDGRIYIYRSDQRTDLV
jgi:hypothetical protein